MARRGQMKNDLVILTPTLALVLLTRGKVCLVDTADLPRLGQHRWCAIPAGKRWYAATAKPGRQAGSIFMHRMLCEAPAVDHINRNGLDNRRCNLRPATPSENGANAGLRSHNSSGYKGVSAITRKSGAVRFRAHLGKDGRRIALGTFATAEEAALAYNAAALHAFGVYALLNQVPEKGLH